MKPIHFAIAGLLAALPVAAGAYDKTPSHPPASGSSGGGSSGGHSGNPTPVPEPAAFAMFGAGIVGVWGVRQLRRRRRG